MPPFDIKYDHEYLQLDKSMMVGKCLILERKKKTSFRQYSKVNMSPLVKQTLAVPRTGFH